VPASPAKAVAVRRLETTSAAHQEVEESVATGCENGKERQVATLADWSVAMSEDWSVATSGDWLEDCLVHPWEAT
jgi:hypothetical protein